MSRVVSLAVSLCFSAVLVAQQSPDLIVTLAPIVQPASGTAATVQATLRNRTAAEVRDIDVDIVLVTGTRASISATNHPAWPASQWSCANVAPRHVRCRAFSIAPGPDQFIPLMVTIDPAREGRFVLTAQATWMSGGATLTSEPYTSNAVFPRELRVVNTNDSGAGSLRATLEQANDECARDGVPCVIHFAIAEPPSAQSWFTIRPATPLPAITAPDLTIDGARQGGSGPAIELDGSLLGSGHGLDLRGDGPMSVTGLAIGGFAWDAITVARRGDAANHFSTQIYNCFIGVHPDQSPNPNGSRGVTVNAPASNVAISNSLISANARSGIFIAGGSAIDVRQNLIGSIIGGPSPLSNGASGIYVGPAARDVTIVENTITGNAQFGIAVARGAAGIRLYATNRILANGLLPLDHGLDGFSGYGREGNDPARTPAPRIVAVGYNAETNTTTFRGTLDVPDPSKQWKVTLYAPSDAWTDLPLPSAIVKDNVFTFSFPGRLRSGTEVTAYADSDDPMWSTSEFAEPVIMP